MQTFKPQADIQHTAITFKLLSSKACDLAVHHNLNLNPPSQGEQIFNQLFGDHRRLKQILINLVKNALKYT